MCQILGFYTSTIYQLFNEILSRIEFSLVFRLMNYQWSQTKWLTNDSDITLLVSGACPKLRAVGVLNKPITLLGKPDLWTCFCELNTTVCLQNVNQFNLTCQLLSCFKTLLANRDGVHILSSIKLIIHHIDKLIENISNSVETCLYTRNDSKSNSISYWPNSTNIHTNYYGCQFRVELAETLGIC